MDLDLVHHRLDFLVHAQVHQPLGGEIAHPDGPDRALPVQPLHRPPCAIVVPKGLVDQVQVDMFHPQRLPRAVKGPQRFVIPGVLHPQLGGDQPFLSGQPGAAQGRAHGRFILIGCRGVKQAVPCRESICDALLTLAAVPDLKGAVSDHRQFDPVVERPALHSTTSSILAFSF